MGQMTAEEAAEWGKTLSFEKVWAAMMESDRRMEEYRREHAEFERRAEKYRREHAEFERRTEKYRREHAESIREIRETTNAIKKMHDELKRENDRLSKNVGGLGSSLGELIETLIAARLWEKFPDYGLVRAYRRVPIFDDTNRARTDIDILLSNTNKAMAVEVKHELDREMYVEQHLKRMELIRAYPPAEVGNKELFGAMAGGIVTPDVTRYAHDSGFHVLELMGDTVSLIPPPAGFKAGTW
ncbi:MAG: hypothetical protein LBF80_06660 [Spirochaetaceae bacterium]|jgi:chromosome segregation ATPase|nr:hypothetical protein [Spirochaetaceae bacterium]